MRKPGCAAKSTYDAETLAVLNAAGPHDELEDMFERGWSDGLPVIPPTRERVDAMLGGRDPSRLAGRGASGDGRGDARAGRIVCGARRLPARVLPGRRRGRAGGARAGLQSQRPGRHHAAGGTAGDPQRPGATLARPQQLDRSARTGTARKPDDRTRAATVDQPHRRRLPRQARPRDARSSRQDRLLHGRERGGQPVGAAVGPARLRARHIGRDGGRLRRAAVDLRSPQPIARGARPGAGGGSGRDVESELVAAGWGVAVRDLPRARTAVRRSRMEQAATARGDVRGGAASCRRAALGRDHAARARRPRRPPDLQVVRASRTYCVVVAGGEAGRYSAVFGPCLGMQTEIVSKEVPWIT